LTADTEPTMIVSGKGQDSKLKDCFPDTYDRIVEILHQDEDFKELCSDYVTTLLHIDRLASEKVANFELHKEFRTLCDSLMLEISTYLNTHRASTRT